LHGRFWVCNGEFLVLYKSYVSVSKCVHERQMQVPGWTLLLGEMQNGSGNLMNNCAIMVWVVKVPFCVLYR
jgi:hypothetical protein